MSVWNKLDEVILGGLLAGIGITAMYLGYDGGTVQICATGIVAIATGKAAKEAIKKSKDISE